MSTKFYSLKIASVEALTSESVLLNFDVTADLKNEFQYHQGQHLTLRAEINGEDIRRSYSLCSSVDDQILQVAVKRIPDGIFSNYANESLSAGMTLDVMAPQGHFYTELDKNNAKSYLFVATGSGITPVISNILSILHNEPQSKVTLIYGNKTSSLMMFREKLSFIKNEYIDRFNWVNCFTKEENDAEILNGRISTDKLVAMESLKIIDSLSFDDVFLCGAESMIEELNQFFQGRNIADENIHYELFFAGDSADEVSKKQQARAAKFTGKVSEVSVKVSGRKTIMSLPMDGDNILDAAMANGADLPFSCKGGVCATCKAKLVKGQVDMDRNHSLTEEEVSQGMILTCQAHPLSEEVEIDFDFS
ncbi:MAG: FAD-binding oxidoreductase [Gammaproteobacteria bacterium]|nr:FAD-binding oxidoreductase [Gammaproteobacteria bacterium]MDH5629473.1 FAD-binding oxidoreductase [Gammaproteobacteria bacterium]